MKNFALKVIAIILSVLGVGVLTAFAFGGGGPSAFGWWFLDTDNKVKLIDETLTVSIPNLEADVSGIISLTETGSVATPSSGEATLYLDSTNEGRVYIKDSTGYTREVAGEYATRYIHTEDDLPPINGANEHPLEAGVKYVFDDPSKVNGSVVLDYPLRLPLTASGYGVQMQSSSDNQTIVIYNGTGALLRSDGTALFWTRFLDFVGDGTNTLYDVDGGDTGTGSSFETVYHSLNSSASDFADVGTIKNYALATDTNNLNVNNIEGITYDSIRALTINNIQIIDDFSTASGAALTLSGSIYTANIDITSSSPSASGRVIDLDSSLDATLTAAKLDILFSDENGGSVYAPGSFKYDDPRVHVTGVGVRESTTFGSMSFTGNGTGTEISVQGDWYKIAGLTVEESEIQRFSMTDDNELTYTGLEDIIVEVSVSSTLTSGSATEKSIDLAIFKNGVIVNSNRIKNSTVGNAFPSITFFTPVKVSKDDVLDVRLRNNTNTTDITAVFLSVDANK